MIIIRKNTKSLVWFEKESRDEKWFDNDCSDENIKKQCGREEDTIVRVQFVDGKHTASELMVYFGEV